MDFASLDLGITKDKKPKATETTVETKLMINGAPIKNGAGKDLVITMLAPGSPEAVKHWKMWEKKFGLSRPADHIDATDAELEELVGRDEQAGADLAARIVCGWNVEAPGGKAAECSRETRMAFFGAHEVAAVAVMLRAQELAKEAGKSKAA